MKFLVAREPWINITEAMNSSNSKFHCAVSYIGIKAPSILPLQAGDILVCDATEGTVASGATNPKALITYINRGVEVYSRRNLHAKVIVSSRTAWIGSANASTGSRDRLIEANIRLTENLVVRQARQFVLDQAKLSRPVDLKMARDLVPLFRESSPLGPHSLPDTKRRIKVLRVDYTQYSPTEERHFDAHRKAATSAKSRVGTKSKLTTFLADSELNIKIGDWILFIIGDKVESPSEVVDISKTSKTVFFWMAQPESSVRSIRQDALEGTLGRKFPKTDEFFLPLTTTEKVIEYFRK